MREAGCGRSDDQCELYSLLERQTLFPKWGGGYGLVAMGFETATSTATGNAAPIAIPIKQMVETRLFLLGVDSEHPTRLWHGSKWQVVCLSAPQGRRRRGDGQICSDGLSIRTLRTLGMLGTASTTRHGSKLHSHRIAAAPRHKRWGVWRAELKHEGCSILLRLRHQAAVGRMNTIGPGARHSGGCAPAGTGSLLL